MPSKQEYRDFIQRSLNELSNSQDFNYPEDRTKAIAYQLGFLQGFLIKLMSERREIAGEFKDQIRATTKLQSQSTPRALKR